MNDPNPHREASALYGSDGREIETQARLARAGDDQGQQRHEHEIDPEQQTQPLPTAVRVEEEIRIPDLDDDVREEAEDRQTDSEMDQKGPVATHEVTGLTESASTDRSAVRAS